MPRTRLTSLARLAVLALALGSIGCRSEPPTDTYYVRLTSVEDHGGQHVPEERVHAILRRALEGAASFEPAERDLRSGGGSGTVLAASLEYRELPDPDDRGRDLLVRLAIETPRDLVDELGHEGLDATVLLERESGDVDLDDDLQLAADRLARIVQARTDLARRTPGKLAALLRDDDPQLIALTLEWVRDHADEGDALAEADRVAELINHVDQDVRLLAIETLGAIGGPQHVAALLERLELNDADQVARAYDALARLGGGEARTFLEFAARNEDEPDLQRAAVRALRRLDGHSDASLIERVRGRGHR
ncbi:HEAT repeat domain-containing protein [Nannocystaceae bacterium ST9]